MLESLTVKNFAIIDNISIDFKEGFTAIYDSKVIHADETPVKVMRIDNAKDQKREKDLYVGLPESVLSKVSHPIVLYDWQDSRRSDHPREFLKTLLRDCSDRWISGLPQA